MFNDILGKMPEEDDLGKNLAPEQTIIDEDEHECDGSGTCTNCNCDDTEPEDTPEDLWDVCDDDGCDDIGECDGCTDCGC